MAPYLEHYDLTLICVSFLDVCFVVADKVNILPKTR